MTPFEKDIETYKRNKSKIKFFNKTFTLYLGNKILLTYKSITMTPFEKAVNDAKEGKLKTPLVTVNDSVIDAFYYQLSHHVHYLKMRNLGLTIKGFSVPNVKRYYGLKSSKIADCLKELTIIKDNYAKTLKNNKIETVS